MPPVKVQFYQDSSGEAPVLDWLNALRRSHPKAWAQCFARIEQLSHMGHELRRPAADVLKNGIYELRAKHQTLQCRILYFFHERNFVILAAGHIKKQSKVDESEIKKAMARRDLFERNPQKHTFQGFL